MTRVSNDKVRPFGHHAYRPVFGFVEPHPGLGFDGQRTMGVVADVHWIYGGFRSLLRARGTFLGRDVEGYMQMDYACLPDGKDWYSGLYLKDLQGVWPYFTTEYSDGNFDHGMFYCGKERFNGFCVESTDRDPVVVLDPEFEVEFDDNEYPIRFSVDVGNGEVWDWTRPPGNKARIPSTNIEHSPRWTQDRIARFLGGKAAFLRP